MEQDLPGQYVFRQRVVGHRDAGALLQGAQIDHGHVVGEGVVHPGGAAVGRHGDPTRIRPDLDMPHADARLEVDHREVVAGGIGHVEEASVGREGRRRGQPDRAVDRVEPQQLAKYRPSGLEVDRHDPWHQGVLERRAAALDPGTAQRQVGTIPVRVEHDLAGGVVLRARIDHRLDCPFGDVDDGEVS